MPAAGGLAQHSLDHWVAARRSASALDEGLINHGLYSIQSKSDVSSPLRAFSSHEWPGRVFPLLTDPALPSVEAKRCETGRELWSLAFYSRFLDTPRSWKPPAKASKPARFRPVRRARIAAINLMAVPGNAANVTWWTISWPARARDFLKV